MLDKSNLKDEALNLSWRLRHIEAGIRTAVQLVDSGEWQSASLLAGQYGKRLQQIIDDLRGLNKETELYLDVVLSNKTPSLLRDLQILHRLESVTEDDLKYEDLDGLKMTIFRFETESRLLSKEILRLLPPPDNMAIRIFKSLCSRRNLLIGMWTAIFILSMALVTFKLDQRRHSLVGEYYSDKTLSTLYRTRLDPTIDFRWGVQGPFFTGFPTDLFSIRWTGFLHTETDGTYEFRTEADDGVRVWIDQKLVIDDWLVHALNVTTAQMDLKAGVHAIKVEYFEDFQQAQLRLLWRPPGENNFQVIPYRCFSHEG